LNSSAANERLQRKYQLRAKWRDVDKVAERVATLLDLPIDAVWEPGNHRNTVEARGLLCYWSVWYLGVSMSYLARRLRISMTSVSRSVTRDEALAKRR
jgi:hypothetical protein